MKVSKKLAICGPLLLASSNCLFAASGLFPSNLAAATATKMIQVIGCGGAQKNSSIFIQNLYTTIRNYSSSSDSSNNTQRFLESECFSKNPDVFPQVSTPEKLVLNEVKRLKILLTESRDLLWKIKKTVDEDNSAPILSSHSLNPDFRYSSGQKDRTEDDLDILDDSPNPRISKNTMYYQEVSKSVDKMRSDLVDRIMQSTSAVDVMSRNDVELLLDLYTALPKFSVESLTKVLTGQIDTGKSAIYRAVLKHASVRRVALMVYREVYVRLCRALLQDASQVVCKSIEDMQNEKKHMLKPINMKNGKDMSWEDYISLVVAGAHPLYLVYPHEVKSILDLYTALPKFSVESLTKVLTGQIDTGKSAIYRDVLQYIKRIPSSLETYRDIYARLSKAENGTPIKTRYSILNNKENHSGINQVQKRNSEGDTLLAGQNMGLLSTNKSADTWLQTIDGKYHISHKEQERLNQIYLLLPGFHGKSITAVLSGDTIKEQLPAWGAVMSAINQIRTEAEQAGDKTQIDLNYFRNLYWSSFRIVGKDGLRKKGFKDRKAKLYITSTNKLTDKASDARLQTTDCQYPASSKEKERLNMIYRLLPRFHGKSITAVLSGKTIKEQLPAWSAVMSAINQIRTEAEQAGDKTQIDLNYFRNLYLSSVRDTEN